MPHRRRKASLGNVRYWVKFSAITALLVVLAGYLSGYVPPPGFKPSQEEVWKYVRTKAPAYHLDPHFVYAIAMAESSLRPNAFTFHARGMMQLSRAAWEDVSPESYRHAWNWRMNVHVGLKYLQHCRHFLEKHNAFSYANLAAAYHYGPAALKKRHFDAQAFLPHKPNKIYHALLNGEAPPVTIPKG